MKTLMLLTGDASVKPRMLAFGTGLGLSCGPNVLRSGMSMFVGIQVPSEISLIGMMRNG